MIPTFDISYPPQELWAAAREQEGRLAERADSIRTVRALLALFPQVSTVKCRET
jgi:hypothetical protein